MSLDEEECEGGRSAAARGGRRVSATSSSPPSLDSIRVTPSSCSFTMGDLAALFAQHEITPKIIQNAPAQQLNVSLFPCRIVLSALGMASK